MEGIDVQSSVLPAALGSDPEANATFPGIVVHGATLNESGAVQNLASEQIGMPTNQWSGANRGGWSNPDYDLLWNRYNTTLVRAEQIQALVQMQKIRSEQVPSFPLYYLFGLVPQVAALKGPQGDSSHWNIHEWELIT